MKPAILIAIGLFVYSLVNSQTVIKLEDVRQHIGDSVTVCGKVYNARYIESANNSPTFLNLGATYPNQLLTVVIWGEVRKNFISKPEEVFLNKNVCIIGKVEIYKDRPQVILRKSEQIFLKE